MEATVNSRHRMQFLERIARDLGNHHAKLEGLIDCIRFWQKEIDEVERYVAYRQEWISGAESRITQLQREIRQLEEVYHKNYN
jgi:FtsZ-binding cell division protein ZapB